MAVTDTLDLSPGGILAVAVILPAVATIALFCRLLERRFNRIEVKLEDWILCTGLGLLWGLATICYVGVDIGALGNHSKPPQPGDKPDITIHRTKVDDYAEKIVLAYSLTEKFAFLAIKASVVLSYRRIFPQQHFKTICLFLLVLLHLIFLSFIIASALQCPLRNWGVWYQSWALANNCAQAELVWVGYSVADVVTDLALLLVPIPMLLNMHLALQRKLVTLAVFAAGSLSTGVGMARMIYLFLFTYTGTKGYRDLLALQSTVLVFSLIEASVAIFAACLPAIRKLLFRDAEGNSRRIFRSPFGSSQAETESGRSDRGFVLPEHLRIRTITSPVVATFGEAEKAEKGDVKDVRSAGVDFDAVSPGFRMRDGFTRFGSFGS